MDALLLKKAELAHDEIDKILLKASHQFDLVSPPSAKRPKMGSTGSDRFGAAATSSQIQQMRQDAIPFKAKQTTSWSTRVWEEWCTWHKNQPATEEEGNFPLCQDITSMNCVSMDFWLCHFVVEVQ